MEKEKYTYEKYKDSCSDVKYFIESIDLSKLEKDDLDIIDYLKDAWVNYEWRFVNLDYYGDERKLETAEIFKASNNIKEENTKEKALKFAYNYLLGMIDDDIIYGREREEINKLLESVGVLNIENYLTYREQVKALKMTFKK